MGYEIMKILCILLILFILGVVWLLIEAQVFKVTTLNLENKVSDANLNIAFISDIHYGRYYFFNRLKRIVNKMNTLDADIVIIGGDFINIEKGQKLKKDYIHKMCSEFSKIKSKYGVYAILGNHDYYLEGNTPLLVEELTKNNVNVLLNETKSIDINGSKIYLHGLDDLLEGNPDIKKLNIQKNELNILVSHNPDIYETINIPVEYMLAGHTHGGQVNFFGLYAPKTASDYGQKYIKQINKNNNSTIITSKGIGCSKYPIRFFACPEIMKLEIKSN